MIFWYQKLISDIRKSFSYIRYQNLIISEDGQAISEGIMPGYSFQVFCIKCLETPNFTHFAESKMYKSPCWMNSVHLWNIYSATCIMVLSEPENSPSWCFLLFTTRITAVDHLGNSVPSIVINSIKLMVLVACSTDAKWSWSSYCPLSQSVQCALLFFRWRVCVGVQRHVLDGSVPAPLCGGSGGWAQRWHAVLCQENCIQIQTSNSTGM